MAAAVKPPSILLPSSSPLGAGNNPVAVPNKTAPQAPAQAPVANGAQNVAPASAVTPKPILANGAQNAAPASQVTPNPIFANGPGKAPGTTTQTVPVQQNLSSSQESLASNAVPPLSPGGSQSSTLADSVKTDHTWDDAETTTNASSTAGELTPRSSMMGSPTPKIRFGNCPERPPELRRRNSITLGVLARKSMLHAQGTLPGGTRVVNMTDEEWEAYQRKFQRNDQAPVDLGKAVSSGAKKLWGKVRRGSNASVSSAASSSGRGRSDSASSAPGMPISPRVRPVDTAPPIEEHAEEEEEDRVHLPARMRTPPPGEETPRIGRSPSPPPHRVFDEEEDDDYDSSEEGEHREEGNDHGLDDAAYVHRSRHSNSVAALGFEIGDYKHRAPAFASRGSRTSLRSLLLEEEENAPATSAHPVQPAQAAPAPQAVQPAQHAQAPVAAPGVPAQQPQPFMQQAQQPRPIMQQPQQAPQPIMQQQAPPQQFMQPRAQQPVQQPQPQSIMQQPQLQQPHLQHPIRPQQANQPHAL